MEGRSDSYQSGLRSPTTMSPKVEVEVAKYTELLGKTKKTAEEAATFAKLSEWMRGTIPVAAETAAEREAFALVEDALLEVIRTRPVSEREQILSMTRKLLAGDQRT